MDYYCNKLAFNEIRRNRRILKMKNEGGNRSYTENDMKKYRYNSMRCDLVNRDRQNEEILR